MVLYIDNLTKKYGKKTVLDIKSLTIEKEKITGITGPNGCGKSTLLNIISGIDDEFSGRIRYNGQALSRSIVEHMTYVFQKPYLFKRSVLENIAYPLKLRGLSHEQRDKRAMEMMVRFEIEGLKDERADLLSGGESQKVALARALVFEPKLLLLDEPTSSIDPDSIQVMEREILDFNKKTQATIVIVTHNMDQASRLCHNILSLNQGKVVDQ